MRSRLSLACLMLLFWAAESRAEAPASKPQVVPFDLLQSKHIVVMVKINGHGPYRVIFDTGAPVSLVNTRVARASGVVGKSAQAPLFSPFGSMGAAKIETLELGGLKVRDTSAVVMDHPTVEVISKILGPVEGILGFPFFARFRMTIDYQRREMTFVPNGYDPPDAMEALMASVMLLTENKPGQQKVLQSAAQWGLVLDKEKNDEQAGVTVKEVLSGSAAAAAGLKAGDRLLSLDGRWTDSLADAYSAAGHVKPERATTVMIRRGGKEMELTVKPRSGL
jgi:hypothetical protein